MCAFSPKSEGVVTSAAAVVVSAASSAEEHVEYIVGVSVGAAPVARVIQLVDICALVVPSLLLFVTQYRIGLADVLEHLVCIVFAFLISTGVFIGMPE